MSSPEHFDFTLRMIPLIGCLLLLFDLYRVAIRVSDDERHLESKLTILIRD